MAIQSAFLLSERLVARQDKLRGACVDDSTMAAVGRDYAASWRRSFIPRIRVAAVLAHLAMRPDASRPLLPLLQRWPALLTATAQLGAKVRHVVRPAVVRGIQHHAQERG